MPETAPGTAMHVTVRVAVAPLLAEAHPAATQRSQLLRGHHAVVLERAGAWRKLRGVDGYEGWCHEGYLTPPRAPEALALPSAWMSQRRLSIGCIVRRPDGTLLPLPLGALLDAEDVVLSGLAINGRGRGRYFAREGALLVRRAAEAFSGTPYLWGGVTPWGADCSGMVQTMYALHDVQLPRDAWQQAACGAPVPDHPSARRPADLLFFSDRDDRRVTHVAISLGDSRIAHVSLANGGFAVDALDADAPVPAALRKTLLFARRVL